MKQASCLAVFVLLAAASVALAGTRSDSKVKIASSHAKDASGRTVVVFKLTISPPWHLYANPPGNKEVDGQKLVVTSSVPAKIEYPRGTPYTDKYGAKFLVYESTVEVRAVLDPPASEANPEFTFQLQVCDDKGQCLFPATVTRTLK